VKILLAYFLYSSQFRHRYLAHGMAVRTPSPDQRCFHNPLSSTEYKLQAKLGSGGSSRHNSHVLVSSTPLALWKCP